MALQPFHGKVTVKKSYWKKSATIANILALASIIALVITFVISTNSANTANDRADMANEKRAELQQQLNSLLNSSLEQTNYNLNQSLELAQIANNLTQAANNLNQQMLNLQQMQLNFSTSVIPYPLSAKVYGEYWDISTNVTDHPVIANGNTSINLMIITPHYGRLHFSLANFTTNSNQGFFVNNINPTGINTTLVYAINPVNISVSLGALGLNYVSSYDAPISIGINQVNFTIPVTASFPIETGFLFNIRDLPSQTLPIQDRIVPETLGTIYFTGNLLDGETQQLMPINFSVDLIVYIDWHFRSSLTS